MEEGDKKILHVNIRKFLYFRGTVTLVWPYCTRSSFVFYFSFVKFDVKLQLNPDKWRRDPSHLWELFSSWRKAEQRREESFKNGERRGEGWILLAILRGPQGQVRARVSGVRVQTRWQAPLREQLQLQKRHHHPQGGLPQPCRFAWVPPYHRRERNHEGRRQQLARTGPSWTAGAGDCDGERAHFLHHFQDWISRRCSEQCRSRRATHILLSCSGHPHLHFSYHYY